MDLKKLKVLTTSIQAAKEYIELLIQHSRIISTPKGLFTITRNQILKQNSCGTNSSKTLSRFKNSIFNIQLLSYTLDVLNKRPCSNTYNISNFRLLHQGTCMSVNRYQQPRLSALLVRRYSLNSKIERWRATDKRNRKPLANLVECVPGKNKEGFFTSFFGNIFGGKKGEDSKACKACIRPPKPEECEGLGEKTQEGSSDKCYSKSRRREPILRHTSRRGNSGGPASSCSKSDLTSKKPKRDECMKQMETDRTSKKPKRDECMKHMETDRTSKKPKRDECLDEEISDIMKQIEIGEKCIDAVKQILAGLKCREQVRIAQCREKLERKESKKICSDEGSKEICDDKGPEKVCSDVGSKKICDDETPKKVPVCSNEGPKNVSGDDKSKKVCGETSQHKLEEEKTRTLSCSVPTEEKPKDILSCSTEEKPEDISSCTVPKEEKPNNLCPDEEPYKCGIINDSKCNENAGKERHVKKKKRTRNNEMCANKLCAKKKSVMEEMEERGKKICSEIANCAKDDNDKNC